MSNDIHKELGALTDRFLRTYCEMYPYQGVWLGFHEYDGRLPDLSRARLTARVAELHRFLDELEKIDPAGLADLDWLDHQLVFYQASFEAFVLEDWRRWERDPVYYIEMLDVSRYILFKYAPLEQRVEALAAHLQGFPAFVAAMQENLTQASAPVVEIGARIARGTATFLQNDLPLALAGLEDAELGARFEVIRQETSALMEQVAAWLENDLAPRAVADYAIGPQRFARMLATGEAIDLPLERLWAVGEEDLARNKAAYLETAARIAPDKTPQQVIADGLHHHPTPESLVADVRQLVDDLRRVIVERGIVAIPYDENCIVAETPAFFRYAFAMLCSPGPFEQVAREAYYFVTPPEPDWPAEKAEEWMSSFAYYVIRSTTIHEAWPGHYLHDMHARNAPTRTSKAFGAYTFFEGWAHYVEQMMLEIGWHAGDPWARMGQLSEALLRNVRFVCALGLHTSGMTVEQAQQRFMDDAFTEPAVAREEALRGTWDPQYLNYTLGKLAMLKLREDLRARQGADFDLRTFHDRLLAYGAPPIPLVRGLLLGRDDREAL